jgi:hypothetical protein
MDPRDPFFLDILAIQSLSVKGPGNGNSICIGSGLI